MGEKPDQITRDIVRARTELGSNLREIESRVKGMTDWRYYFDAWPFTMLGVAFGGGLLLAATLGSRRKT